MNRTIVELFAQVINPSLAKLGHMSVEERCGLSETWRSQMTEEEVRMLKSYRKRWEQMRDAVQQEYKACKISKKIKQALNAKIVIDSQMVCDGLAEMTKLSPLEWVHNNKDKC